VNGAIVPEVEDGREWERDIIDYLSPGSGTDPVIINI